MPRYEVRSTTDEDGEDVFYVWDTDEGVEVEAFWQEWEANKLADDLNSND